MSSDFHHFAAHVHARFKAFIPDKIYAVGNDGQKVWEAYLSFFPAGTDPIFRVNTEHTCSCCRNFVKNLGAAVMLKDGVIHTVWDSGQTLPHPYNVVAERMHQFVLSLPLNSIYRTNMPSYGNQVTKELLADGKVHNWNHFHATLPALLVHKEPDAIIGVARGAIQVAERGLNELTIQAVYTVLELMEQKTLYRGEEFKDSVQAFRDLKRVYDKLPITQQEVFAWENYNLKGAQVRNSVIGTLLIALSEGVDTEDAVKAYEAKVAPANYKRPTALITPKMVEAAMAEIKEQGLETALERRHARLADIKINNVLWADTHVKPTAKGGLMDALMEQTVKTPVKVTKDAEDVSIHEFMQNILPKAKSMEVLLTGKHLGNFVSLTAPVHPDSERLFKWDNKFAWSYDGSVTDSITAKVKAAGGNVDALMRFSLAWSNFDDLDFHLRGPSGAHVYFGRKIGAYAHLDVDMNAGGGSTRTPVENIALSQLPDGLYAVSVNQYHRRESIDVGYTVQYAYNGQIIELTSAKSPAQGDFDQVVTLTVKKGEVVDFKPGPGLTVGASEQDKWGLTTENFARVKTVMYSPNHWDEQNVGNRHWFFILDGCRNPDPVRGVYNEFLMPGMEKHRKVFEVLGDKT